MGPDRAAARVLAALALGAELLRLGPDASVRRAGELLRPEVAPEADGEGVTMRDPDLAADEYGYGAPRFGSVTGECAERQDDSALLPALMRRRERMAVLREVRSDLLELMRRCGRPGLDPQGFEAGIAAGLGSATGKLASGADPDAVRAWRRGMVLKLVEVPVAQGPPRVLATVDGGPGVGPVVVEWDSCERRVALVSRLLRAGVPPAVVCDRLLADLSMSSPLRYSYR